MPVCNGGEVPVDGDFVAVVFEASGRVEGADGAQRFGPGGAGVGGCADDGAAVVAAAGG